MNVQSFPPYRKWAPPNRVLHRDVGKFLSKMDTTLNVENFKVTHIVSLGILQETDLPSRYSPRGMVPLTHSSTPALGVNGTTCSTVTYMSSIPQRIGFLRSRVFNIPEKVDKRRHAK